METLNIKDYLKLSEKTKNKSAKKTEYTFELVFDNGSDFIVERTASRNVKRQLCFIASENLLFIRDPKSGTDTDIKTESQIKTFFGTDNATTPLEFKNTYFKTNSASTLAYTCLKLKKNNLFRNFVKYGFNPEDYLWRNNYGSSAYIENLNDVPFQDVLLITKTVEQYRNELNRKNGQYKPEICSEFILFLYNLKERYSIDFVRMFLDIYTKYDSKLEINLSSYHQGTYHNHYRFYKLEEILDLKMDAERFFIYLFRDLYAQGISEVTSDILSTYSDTLRLQKEIYGKVRDKYPEHLKECHDKLVLIYNLNQAYFLEKKVEALKIHNKELELIEKDYSIIAAKTSQDLISEGINLHHCVGSYVDKVNRAECSIFFLRKTDEIDTSLITIEVQGNSILQVRGLCERRANEEEKNFILHWCTKKGLKLISE